MGLLYFGKFGLFGYPRPGTELPSGISGTQILEPNSEPNLIGLGIG
jgi:hypothetical protein